MNFEDFTRAIVLDKPIITTIKTSDDKIDIEEYAYIIPKDEKEMVNIVKEVITKKKKKRKYNLEEIQEQRMLSLEKIFNEVI